MEKTAVVYGRGFEVLLGNERAQAAQMVIEQGGVEGGPGSHHEKSDQWLFVISGEGVAVVNGKEIKLKPGSLVLIEKGEMHEIRNTDTNPLQTLNFYVPPAY